VLLAVPALRALRTQHPGRPLVLAAQPRIGRLLADVGEVDRAVDFEALGLGALFAAEPDAGAVALARAGRVVCWFASRDPRFVANLRAVAPDALVASPAGDGQRPVWCHLLRTVAPPASRGVQAMSSRLRASMTVPEGARGAGREALREAGWDEVTPLLVLHPGAGSPAKRWPVPGFAAVADDLRRSRRLAVAVHEGPADAQAASALAPALGREAIVLRNPSLPVLAGALTAASVYVGNDSGVSHLAAAVGAPTVVLFTRALLAWRAWAAHAQTIAVSIPDVVAAEAAEVTARALAAMAVDSTTA
jgi:ADP-heptose:LPS heptosyltransferase